MKLVIVLAESTTVPMHTFSAKITNDESASTLKVVIQMFMIEQFTSFFRIFHRFLKK